MMAYLIKWNAGSDIRMCTEPTLKEAMSFVLKCGDPCPMIWAVNLKKTERAKEQIEKARREKEAQRRAAFVSCVVRYACFGEGCCGPGTCSQCAGLGCLELERWK